MIELNGKYTSAKIMIDAIEESCMAQIVHFVNHPAFTNPVAIMPDTHAGKGAVIGFCMKMTDKIIPETIGVDVGCGVSLINIGPELNMSFEEIDHKIRQRVPFGMNINERPILNMEKEFPWHKANVLAEKFRKSYQDEFNQGMDPVFYDINWFLGKVDSIGANRGRVINSIGSLGGGNHACEIGISASNQNYWIMIHTGSRNFGKCICDYWQTKASKKDQKQSKEEKKQIIENLKASYTGKELYEKIKAFKNQPEAGTSKETDRKSVV